MAFLIGSTAPELQRLLVPFVCALIAFLAYAPQWLFAHSPDLAPGPLTAAESRLFNALVACLWWTYYKAVTVDPGRYVFPPDLLKRMRRRYDKDKDEDKDKSSRTNKKNRSKEEKGLEQEADDDEEEEEEWLAPPRRRWCKKCAAPKPPRAHHCKTCRRCVPRMDHHCPWTANCVSLQTFPHFLRFLVCANLALWALLGHVRRRLLGLWAARHLPAYLGPPAPHLALLAVVALAAAATAFVLGILLATTARGWLLNTTMIEAWEIERHEAALARRPGYGGDGSSNGGGGGNWWRSGESAPGGDLAAPHLALDAVEFPYDVGIFANMAQAMGTRNVLAWFWPFAGGPAVAAYGSLSSDGGDGDGMPAGEGGTGWRYEENGLNDREGMWPPVDPEKARHARLWRERRREMEEQQRFYGSGGGGGGSSREYEYRGPEEEREAFRRRQERDLRRWRGTRARIMGELEEVADYDHGEYDDDEYRHRSRRSRRIPNQGFESSWANADGEKLGDFGVDEDAELDDPPVFDERLEVPLGEGEVEEEDAEDDEVPLAELIRRRKVLTKDGEDT